MILPGIMNPRRTRACERRQGSTNTHTDCFFKQNQFLYTQFPGKNFSMSVMMGKCINPLYFFDNKYDNLD